MKKEISKTRKYVSYVVLVTLFIGMAFMFIPKIIDNIDIRSAGFADDFLTDEQEEELKQSLIKKGIAPQTLKDTIEYQKGMPMGAENSAFSDDEIKINSGQ